MSSTYAWLCTKDPSAENAGEPSRVGTTGPSDAPDDLLARLKAGEGVSWRTKYEAGEDPENHDIVHQGRIVFADPTAESLPDEAFGPLIELSQPDCGAVDIEFRVGNAWTVL